MLNYDRAYDLQTVILWFHLNKRVGKQFSLSVGRKVHKEMNLTMTSNDYKYQPTLRKYSFPEVGHKAT